MSQNIGGIWVRDRAGTKKVTAADVARVVEKYWTTRGAKVDKKSPLDIEPLSVSEGKKRLGYAVMPAASGYIGVLDSERYYADHALAEVLSKTLGTEVFWYTLYGATDGGIARWFKSKKKAPVGYDAVEEFVAEHFPRPFTYFDQLRETLSPKDLEAIELIGFRSVSAEAYDSGPEPPEADDEEEEDEDEGEEAKVPPAKRTVSKKGARPGAKNASAAGSSTAAAPVGPALDATKRAPFKPFRLKYKKAVIARDNIVLAFHCRRPMAKIAAATATVLDAYLAAIPQGVLRWALIGASSTTTRKLTDKTLARAREMLSPKNVAKAELTHFWLGSDDEWPSPPKDEEPEAPAFLFQCDGVSSVKSEKMSWGIYSPTSRIEMRFPSDYLWQLGPDRFVELAAEFASLLPIESGSGALALACNPELSSTSQMAPVLAGPLLLEHPGLDLADDDQAIGGQCRGAHWLTFLGPALLEALGGKQAVLKKLDAGVRSREAGSALLLRSADVPTPDLAPKDRKQLTSIARAIEPVTRFEADAHAFEPEAGERWARRHL